MDYRVVWTRESQRRLNEIADYLIENWSFTDLQNFYHKLEVTLNQIVLYPDSGRVSDSKLTREILITKHNLMIYGISNDTIVIFTIWDNRMNHKTRST